MFRRVILEDWQNTATMIALGLTFAVFVIATIFALVMKKDHASRMANLPLENKKENSPNRKNRHV